MTDPREVCPSNFTQYSTPARGCGRHQTGWYTADSVVLKLKWQTYSKGCRKVLAYQRGTTDAFYSSIAAGQGNIETACICEGSITDMYGPPGSTTYMDVLLPLYMNKIRITIGHGYVHVCTNTRYEWSWELPAFIGDHYFCDTGSAGPGYNSATLFTSDPLWDGEGCGTFSTCCQLNGPPWFYRTLPHTATSDDIELRTYMYC